MNVVDLVTFPSNASGRLTSVVLSHMAQQLLDEILHTCSECPQGELLVVLYFSQIFIPCQSVEKDKKIWCIIVSKCCLASALFSSFMKYLLSKWHFHSTLLFFVESQWADCIHVDLQSCRIFLVNLWKSFLFLATSTHKECGQRGTAMPMTPVNISTHTVRLWASTNISCVTTWCIHKLLYLLYRFMLVVMVLVV